MRILAKTENKNIATVYIAETSSGKMIELVQSVQPPIPAEKKWVLIISTLSGCPAGCRFCDAGGFYKGRLSAGEILDQIDFLVSNKYPDMRVPAEKFKIQFARIGDPAYNPDVLEALRRLSGRYDAPGLMPSISTIAPQGRDVFFEDLLEIKKNIYGRRFQFQFSLHSTDQKRRDWLMPASKWSLKEMAAYGDRFFSPGDRKISLNFALSDAAEINPGVLSRYFDPEKYIIKITPVNPTYKARENNISSHILKGDGFRRIVEGLESAGYQILLSIGELEENKIGSNCGQQLMKRLSETNDLGNSYTYSVEKCKETAA